MGKKQWLTDNDDVQEMLRIYSKRKEIYGAMTLSSKLTQMSKTGSEKQQV